MERIPTGIKELDKMIGGGFTSESIIVVSGGPGSGKTTLAFEFLYNGAKAGEKGLYLSFEETPESIKSFMSEHGFNVEALERSGDLQIVKVNPVDALRLVDEDYGVIHDLVQKSGATRVVLDSLGAFELLIEEGYKSRKSIASLIDWFRESRCTTIVTSEADQTPNNYSRHGIIEFLVDGVIALYNIRRGNLRRRALEVIKMRGTKHSTKIVSFVFNNGVELLPKEDVFN